MGLLPPVIATLLADTKEYMAKMTEAQASMAKLGAESMTTGQKMSAFASKASTAIVGAGIAIAAYGVHNAIKYTEALDAIRNQSNLTAKQVEALGATIMKLSNTTAISTTDLAGAALAIAQAGVSGAKATSTLDAAARAAVSTNASVVDTTKAIVSAQTLQIAKGMDVAKLTGILVAGSKEYVGGLSAEVSMLQGRVGVALANAGIGLKTIIALGSEFAKVKMPTRSIAQLTTGLGNLLKPLTDSKGKLNSYAKGIEAAGLSLNKLVSDARTGNIVAILTQIKDVAAATGEPISKIAASIFGTGGGAGASLLVKNLTDVAKAQKNMTGAGSESLAKAFSVATSQLPFQIKQIKTQLNNALTGIGLALLPSITVVARWVEGFVRELNAHPIFKTIFSDSAIGIFAVALASKIGKAIMGIINTVQSVFRTGAVVANTAALEQNTAALLGKTVGGQGTSLFGKVWGAIKSGAGSALKYTSSDIAGIAGIAATSAYSVWSVYRNPGQVLNSPGSKIFQTNSKSNKTTVNLNLLHSTQTSSSRGR